MLAQESVTTATLDMVSPYTIIVHTFFLPSIPFLLPKTEQKFGLINRTMV